MKGLNDINKCFQKQFMEQGNSYFFQLKNRLYQEIIDKVKQTQVEKTYLNKEVKHLVETELK